MGKLIVIEGLDGSGKSTQLELLYKNLLNRGVDCKCVSFPDYEHPSSTLVKMYLNGEFGEKPNDVNAYAASTFYAVDRYASFKKYWGEYYNDGGVVIAGRYVTSNAVHQNSKLPKEKWDGFLDWLFHYEYDLLGIPAPDAVIYLEVDPAVSQKLMAGRYRGDESRKDIHERNLQYLEQSAKAAAYCAEKLGWKVVRCNKGEKMRSIEEISTEIQKVLGC
jgi:dTMP kinase